MTCAVFGMSAPTMAAAASQGRAVLFTAAGPAEAQQKAVAIAVGDSHSCLLTADSVVECWGSDLNGQLGDGQSGPAAFSTSPVQVSGLVSPTAIAAGGNFTCALQADGTVMCWGNNTYGQLGTLEPGINITTPVSVANLTNATAIVAGLAHACALANGNVYCWGRNDYGEIGAGYTCQGSNHCTYPTPSQVSGLSGVTAIAAGGYHTCALVYGFVECWGRNFYGEIGNGAHGANVLTPTYATGLGGATAIVAGAFHTCALTSESGVQCWGSDANGQIGDNLLSPNAMALAPTDVMSMTSGITAIVRGGNHSCTITSSGGARCWGSNSDGQLGIGTDTNPVEPIAVDVSGLSSGVVALSAGPLSNQHTCALLWTGGVKCWGSNVYGQLGYGGPGGEVTDSYVPIDVEGFAIPIYVTYMPLILAETSQP